MHTKELKIKSDYEENVETENAVLEIAKHFCSDGALAAVCAYENQNLFSRTDLRGRDVLEVGCGCLPACFGIDDNKMPRRYVATDTTDALIKAAYRVDPRPIYRVESALERPLKSPCHSAVDFSRCVWRLSCLQNGAQSIFQYWH